MKISVKNKKLLWNKTAKKEKRIHSEEQKRQKRNIIKSNRIMERWKEDFEELVNPEQSEELDELKEINC